MAEADEVLGHQAPAFAVVDEDPRRVTRGPPFAATGTSAVRSPRSGTLRGAGEQESIARATRAELAEQTGELLGADLQEVGVDVQVDQLDPEILRR